MPWTVHVDVAHRLSCVRMSGILTFEDFVDVQDALRLEPFFDPGFPFLIDLRGTTNAEVTLAQLKDLAARSPVGISTRRAIVVDAEVVFGVARMYEAVRDMQTSVDSLRVCRTLQDAGEWLGVAGLDTVSTVGGELLSFKA